MIGNPVLWLGLRLADLLVGALPARVAYGIADMAGAAWYRAAPARRDLVTESMRRVSQATGRPTDPASLRRLVRRAFVEHARYYLEVLRAPHYPLRGIEQMVSVEDWDHWLEVLRGGAVVAVAHFGNFEPYGIIVGSHGLKVVAPVEEIRPRELYEFLRDRRGIGRIQVIPLRRARRSLLQALRRGEIAALVADRDLVGDGVPVTFFGYPTTMPSGPAMLALLTGARLIVGSCRRIGPDRFTAKGWELDVPRTSDRQADIVAVTRAIAERFEEAIGEAPEQWWGAFQPIWMDQRQRKRSA